MTPSTACLQAELSNKVAVLEAMLSAAPDLDAWNRLPRTQMITEKRAAASPYVGGSDQRPRDIRTLRRWRQSQPRRGPAFVKLGGRYYYTVGALRDFYQRGRRGES